MYPLCSYVKKTRSKFATLESQGKVPPEEVFHKQILPSVVASIKKLCGACPEAEHREAVRQIMIKGGCISGQTDLEKFRATLIELEDYVDGPEEPEPDHPPTEHATDSVESVVKALWQIDGADRLDPGTHYKLHPGGRVRGFTDRCSAPLFEHVDEERFRHHSCTNAFVALLDNYERDDSVKEVETMQEKRELQRFLGALVQTPHMRLVYKALKEWGLVHGSLRDFEVELYELWFAPYSVHGRRGPASSCGFEHVFVGEEKKDRSGKSVLTGLHSWAQFWMEEKKGNIDYLGFMGRAEDDSRVVTVRFAWEDDDPEEEVKPASTFLIGTSVAYDFALLTLCFLKAGGEGEVGIEIEGHPATVKCHKWTTGLHEHIRTAYIDN